MKGLSKGRYDETFAGEDGPSSNKSVKKCEYVLMQLYWEMGTYSHSGIEIYLHT